MIGPAYLHIAALVVDHVANDEARRVSLESPGKVCVGLAVRRSGQPHRRVAGGPVKSPHSDTQQTHKQRYESTETELHYRLDDKTRWLMIVKVALTPSNEWWQPGDSHVIINFKLRWEPAVVMPSDIVLV
jgi:hypothetical protein